MRTIVCLFVLAFATTVAPRAEEGEVLASWKRHEIDFAYMGFTTRYSCEGLRDKMRMLLAACGARPDLEVTARACAGSSWQVTEFPRVRMVFYAPEIPEPGQSGLGEPAAARWMPVTLARRQPRDLELGDCELVEQFRDRILKAFTTRIVEEDINCIPHQLSGSSFRLRFEVLRGLPPPDQDESRRARDSR